MSELVITFENPIVIGKGEAEKEFTEITLREPTAGELEKAMKAGSSMSIGIELIRLVANVPRGVVEKMGAKDFTEASNFLAHFSDSSQKTDELS